ncbi:MAG: hypothetical protein ACRD96_16010 [Bryobacteraceae bacterium]
MPIEALLVTLTLTLTLAVEPRELMRQSLARLEESNRRIADYGYVRHNERKEFSAAGALKSQRTWTVKREPIEGVMVMHLVERDGKPVPAEERARIDEAIRKYVAEAKVNPPEPPRPRGSSDEEAWLKEFPDALDYRPAGEETIRDRTALVLECSPNRTYRPKNMRARVFEKTRGRVWIDKLTSDLIRADVEVFDTVSIGWGMLGRIEKGTRFYLDRRPVDDTYLPDTQTIRFGARMMLFKTMHNEVTTRYSGFRRRPPSTSGTPPTL